MSPAPLYNREGTQFRESPLGGFLFAYQSHIVGKDSIDTLLWDKWYYRSLYFDIVEYLHETTRTNRADLIGHEIGSTIHAIAHRIIEWYQILSISLVPLSRCRNCKNEISAHMITQYQYGSLELVVFGYLGAKIDSNITYPNLSSPHTLSSFIFLFN